LDDFCSKTHRVTLLPGAAARQKTNRHASFLKHYLTMMGATVALPFLLCPALCIEETDPARGYIISTIFFTSGIVTLLQTTFGCRSEAPRAELCPF
jgi:xanthine/uracil permease